MQGKWLKSEAGFILTRVLRENLEEVTFEQRLEQF